MKVVLVLTLTLGLVGCQTLPSAKPAVCDGRHLRPANPPAVTTPQAVTDPKSLKPCGGPP